MAIWKEQNTVRKETSPDTTPEHASAPIADIPQPHAPVHRAPDRKPVPESVIAAGLTIEGTVTGSGDVRIAGQFHGDVHVEGSLTIEVGARMVGSVRASTVIIDGELEGNIEAASRVELHAGGVLNGNLKTGSLTVAAGSRMRGQVEFGWADAQQERGGLTLEYSATA
jgi:cytoskeletal protein CcmA (bactofilin family)